MAEDRVEAAYRIVQAHLFPAGLWEDSCKLDNTIKLRVENDAFKLAATDPIRATLNYRSWLSYGWKNARHAIPEHFDEVTKLTIADAIRYAAGKDPEKIRDAVKGLTSDLERHAIVPAEIEILANDGMKCAQLLTHAENFAVAQISVRDHEWWLAREWEKREPSILAAFERMRAPALNPDEASHITQEADSAAAYEAGAVEESLKTGRKIYQYATHNAAGEFKGGRAALFAGGAVAVAGGAYAVLHKPKQETENWEEKVAPRGDNQATR